MICDDSKGNHWINFSNGNGTFRGAGLVLKGWCGHPGAMTHWADLNGDGKADMTCDDKQGRHWVNLSLGNGKFRDLNGPQVKKWCTHPGSYVQYADVNGDGKADLHCDDT